MPQRKSRPAAAAARTPGLALDPVLWLVPILGLTRAVFWILEPWASEDAYITFRYAGELVAGHGLVYNAGQRVMGFTSAPWALWTALGIALHVDPVGWTRATSLLADVATLLCGAQLLREAAGEAAAWTFGAFFAAWPLFAASATSGLENSAFFATIVVTAWAIGRKSPASGPLLALTALFRPEGLVVALVLALRASWRDRMIALAITAAALATLAAFYGSPIPQSVWAKSSLYGTPGPWAGRHWWEWLLPFPLGRYPIATEGVQFLPIAALFAASLAAGTVVLWNARRSAAATAALGGLAIWLGYSLLGVAYFWWYMVVPVGSLVFTAAAGFPRIVRGRWIPIAAASLLAGTWTVAPSLYVGRAQVESASFASVADFLLDHARAGESVFLEPIGMIGFRCPIRVIDEVGLVSPAVAKRRLAGPGWYADVVAAEKPDWLVIRPDVLTSGRSFAGAGAPFRSEAERDAMLARYDAMAPSAVGGRDLVVLRRKSGS